MLIVNAKLIDGTGAPARDASIEVREGRVEAVRPGSVAARGEEVVDAAGGYVIPGLIDAHDHLTLKGLLLDRGGAHYYDIYRNPAEVQLLQCGHSALLALSRGITTFRDAGAAWFASLRARDAIRSGVLPGPRVLTCGQVLSIPFEGEGVKVAGMTIDADGVDGVKSRVAELAEMGVDFIKLKGHRRDFADLDRTRYFSAEEIVTAGREAHQRGLRFALHAWHNHIVEAGLNAGVADSIEHGNPLADQPELLDRMAADGVILVPNLISWAPSPDRDPRYPNMSGLKLERIWDSVELAIRKGVVLAAGADLHTDQLHSELEAYVKLGLTRQDVLLPVTVNGARLIGAEDKLGTIEQGKLADMVVLPGDPREQLALLAEPTWVICRGVAYDGDQLRRLVADRGPDESIAGAHEKVGTAS
jgi:imidazolonepropionase-like amidohydrolase